MSEPASAVELGRLALRLCQIESPTAQEKAIADEIDGWAKKHFIPGDIVRHGHSFVLGNPEDKRPHVALIGHIDTVPAHGESSHPRIDGDRLIGLGSADMKGALAVMMRLAEDLPRVLLPYNPIFVFYEREEGPYADNGLGVLFDKVPLLSKLAFGLAMEPTDNVVQVGCTGTLHALLTFEGQSAHSARPWQGKNAIHAAGSLLTDLGARQRTEVNVDGYQFFEVMSVTTAKGGRARNIIPEKFELNLNYRFAPGKSIETAQEDVRRFVDNRAMVTFTDLSPSGRVCSDNPHFGRLLKLSGKPAESKQAWTDVARFSVHGVDAVNFGPGESAQAHQKDESTSIAALKTSYDLVARFLRGEGGAAPA